MPGAVPCTWLMFQEVACEQAPKGSEGAGPVRIWGKSVPDGGNSTCKGPEAGRAGHV